MAKFCTNCGNQLNDNAAMCLRCGKLLEQGNQFNKSGNEKNGKKKGLPVWAIVLIVLGCIILIPIILFIILGIIGYNVIKDSGVNIEDYINEALIQWGTIGDTLRTDEFSITLNNALMYSSIEGDHFVDTPELGKEYLVFFFEAENISYENEYISKYDFSGYVDGYGSNIKYLMNDIDGVKELNNELAPGMKINGYIAFEIDTTWREFEIHYDDGDYDDKDEQLIFKVVNEENNKDA